ncbi:DNA-directed RNA polymerase subunit omega [Heliorestis acidaminivorans]|uniref:DNA-directed RNA polymerase subunit omega n=1 Tax=Heliorestis acidaminivorans TaxID=553427 RepID=A0A6I0F6M2_9FIRM|nr:DNA-directed RNA polymerase subunit omega [Heliorestis acidaminivorans]KAB2954477.1 DNA-directed RNA polymerase subunit omega [Heliorestis acidaminivorans]
MNQPSLDRLMENVDSKYALVVLAAKRARALTEKKDSLPEQYKNKKAVTLALQEIVEGKVKYEQPKGGIK